MASSDVSIEELGADEIKVEKDEDAEVLIPENPADVPAVPPVPAEAPSNAAGGDNVEPVIEEVPRSPPPSVNASAAEISASNEDDEEDDDEEDDDDDEIDETLYERLVGLTEMFPESLTKGSVDLVKGSVGATQWLYKTSRVVSWVLFSSMAVMFMPIMIETERLGIEESQKMQQRQILLGPGAAMSGGVERSPPIPPPM